MKPDSRFLELPINFWADIRTISETVGYSKLKRAISPDINQIISAYISNGFQYDHIYKNGSITKYGDMLIDYLGYRKTSLNQKVENLLMDRDEAKDNFDRLKAQLNPRVHLPLNKQKNEKAGPAYFTGIINMLVEDGIGRNTCNFDPHNLPVITLDNRPVQVLSRRVDGAFPSIINPISIWEIKEYYYTTTFGSRVADGVYETQVDGMELLDLLEATNIKVFHYLMIDSHNTWWNMGISYLCRIIDILHMGYIDEVLFGKEVITRLPEIIPEWLDTMK